MVIIHACCVFGQISWKTHASFDSVKLLLRFKKTDVDCRCISIERNELTGLIEK